MPNTIAENLQRLVEAKADIAAAITAKGGTVASGDGFEEFPSDIATIPAGGGSSSTAKDVNFYDYDGTVVNSYSASEFAQLSEMPDNPSHTGLTAQGWNWSLADAKAYVAANGKLEIGQMYTTTDGKTHIHIVLEDGRLEPILGLGVNGSVDIDWGDGSEHTTLTGSNVNTYASTSPHTYPTAGEYTIKLAVTGTARFVSKNSVCGLLMKDGFDANQSKCYINAIKSVNVGNSVTTIESNAFQNCSSLSSITMPEGVTRIVSNAFQNCSSLSSITIPSSVTSIEDNAFDGCYSLRSVTIPESVTSIGNYVFYYCSSLSSITMPEGVTRIVSNAFLNCSSLSSITIPSSVTKIWDSAFKGCYGFGKITFASETPPTVSSSNAFSGIPTDCKIYVPQGSLSAYTSAQNYPSSSTYTYIEY